MWQDVETIFTWMAAAFTVFCIILIPFYIIGSINEWIESIEYKRKAAEKAALNSARLRDMYNPKVKYKSWMDI